ncbi:MAG: hypothetical protein ACI9OD_001370 [Limisphaerales bacterium]|jgi:hypothetical protein
MNRGDAVNGYMFASLNSGRRGVKPDFRADRFPTVCEASTDERLDKDTRLDSRHIVIVLEDREGRGLVWQRNRHSLQGDRRVDEGTPHARRIDCGR